MSVYLASIDNIKANDKFGITETTIMCANLGTGPSPLAFQHHRSYHEKFAHKVCSVVP